MIMKLTIVFLMTMSFALCAVADIQAPPASDQGPTRKLGRGLSNIFFGISEVPVTIGEVNTYEGNNAAASYGVVRGVGRAFARFGYGFYEVFTFPFPTNRGTYQAPYRDVVPNTFSGYTEFPPELGFESRYYYIGER